MNTVCLKSGKYMYTVSYNVKGGLPKYREVKRKIPKIRPECSIYFDKYDDTFKEIMYPKELQNIEIHENDQVETYIHSIMEFMPEWTKITVEVL